MVEYAIGTFLCLFYVMLTGVWLVGPLKGADHFELSHADFNFVRSGAGSYLNRHERAPFYVFIFTAARSLALRARGFKTSSCAPLTGFFVKTCSLAS